MTTTTPTAPEDSRMGDRDDALEAIAQVVSCRGMATPALLYLTAHRPLAFATGQLLVALEPLAGLLGVSACADLAEILSDPLNLQRLQDALAASDGPAASTGEPRHV